jgi:hypothetical protein
MRWIILLLLLVSGFLLYSSEERKWANVLYGKLEEQLGHFMDEKEVQFEGLALLDRTQVLALLPMDKTFTWWRSNRAEIEHGLTSHPLIAAAHVTPCGGLQMRCFSINIQERVPSFLASLGDKVWLLGDDGGFIAPVPQNKLKEGITLPNGKPAIWVVGIVAEQNSPEVVRSRIQYVRKLVDLIETHSGKAVREVAIREGGEAGIRLQGLELLAIFDVSREEQFDRVIEEAQRLKRLLSEFGDRSNRIAQVDLAFNKVAVVKLIE